MNSTNRILIIEPDAISLREDWRHAIAHEQNGRYVTDYTAREALRESYCRTIEAHCQRLTDRPTPDLMPAYREARVTDPELAQLRREIMQASQK